MSKKKTPEQKLLDVIFGDTPEERKANYAKYRAEQRRKHYEEVVPEHVRRIIDEGAKQGKAANAILDNIAPDGYVKFPEGDIQEGEFYPVYNAGEMIRMFQEGVKYGRNNPNE